MLIKHRPEDFVVSELIDFDPQARGPVAIYELRKRKLDTFEAVRRLAAHCRVPLPKIRYVGLKDRQAVTTQLISVEGGARLGGRIPGLRLRYLGRAPEPLSAKNLRGNRFEIVVRDLDAKQVAQARRRVASVNAHGLINYFDDQRFGSLVSGQDMPARHMVKGDFEQAVRLLIATPGTRDPYEEKTFKLLVRKAWGDWETIAKKFGNRRGVAIVRHLRRRDGDFAGALERLPAKERAIHVFAYQSLIWNRAVGLYLSGRFPAAERNATPYSGGEHVWLERSPEDDDPGLPETFPLLDHTSRPEDPAIRAACEQALAEEELTLETFRIPQIPGCFFKHEERALRVWPKDVVMDEAKEDPELPGRLKVGLSFELPPGAYATLTLKRLFGRVFQRGDRESGREYAKRKGRKREDDDRDDAPRGKPKTKRRGSQHRGSKGDGGGEAKTSGRKRKPKWSKTVEGSKSSGRKPRQPHKGPSSGRHKKGRRRR